MVDRTGFTTMWSKTEYVHVAFSSEVVERLDIGVHVVDVVDVRRVFVRDPVLRQWRLHVEQVSFGFGFVIN